MKRFLPFGIIAICATLGLAYVVVTVPPNGHMIEGAFFLLLALGIAGWGSIGIYFLRKRWGPKDSPKFVWRASVKDAFILGVGIVAILVLNVFGDLTWVTGLAVAGLAVVVERLL